MDFSKSKYNCQLSDKDFLKTYPELLTIYSEVESMQTGGHEPLTKAQVIKFTCLSYHLHSPIARESSIHQRRKEALAFLGFPIITKQDFEDNKEIVSLITGSNTFVNRLAIHFCKFENNIDWAELCSLQDMLDDVYLTLKEETEGTDKKSAQEILKLKIEIRSKAQPLREQMRSISQQLFQNDTNLINYSAAHMVLEKRKRLLMPEDIAKYPVEEVVKELKERVGNAV